MKVEPVLFIGEAPERKTALMEKETQRAFPAGCLLF